MTANTIAPEDDRALTQEELAARWQVTVRTLQSWRKDNKGPKHVAIIGKLRYMLSDVVAFEQANNQQGGLLHESRFPEGAQSKGVAARKNKPTA